MSTVERDLARHESRVAEDDRMDAAKDAAIAVELERLEGLSLGEVIASHGFVCARLRDVTDRPAYTAVRIDLDALINALALSIVERAQRMA